MKSLNIIKLSAENDMRFVKEVHIKVLLTTIPSLFSCNYSLVRFLKPDYGLKVFKVSRISHYFSKS